MKNWLPFTLRSLGASLVILSTVFAQPAAKTPAEILQENTAALALILSDGNSTVSLGSGFFIQGGSALVTNFHVIEGARAVYVKAGDGRTFSVDTVYCYDVKQDLAVLKIPAGTTQTVALGDSDKVVTGASITVIGNPEGFEKSVTNGLISGVRTIDGQQLFQISAPISHGSSGGPVFDDKGQVIGVVVASLRDGQNLNFAIPVNVLSKILANRREVSLASLPVIGPEKNLTSLDGAWAATFADSLSSGQMSFTMVQDGATVRGTYTSSLGGGGTVTGQVTNNRFSFALTQAVQGCPGHFEGSVELRSGAMIGSYSGSDCQGAHANGSFSMTKGATAIASPMQTQAVPTTAAAPTPIIEYGDASELHGIKNVFIFGVEPDVRNNMLKEFGKHPQLHVVGRIEEADVVLVFGGQTFFMGTHTNVWTDTYGHTYGNTAPRYGINGQGSVVKLIPPNRIRVIWQFSATRVNVFQRRPSTNMIRDFFAAWDKANR